MMNALEALFMAAIVTIVYLCTLGEKIIQVDFSGLMPRNRKRAKCP